MVIDPKMSSWNYSRVELVEGAASKLLTVFLLKMFPMLFSLL